MSVHHKYISELQPTRYNVSWIIYFYRCSVSFACLAFINLTFICLCITNIFLNYNQQDTFLDLFISTDALFLLPVWHL